MFFGKKSDAPPPPPPGGHNSDEGTPLMSPGGTKSKYYFLGKADTAYQGGTTRAVRDSDAGPVIEGIPAGAHTEEFAPKQLGPMVRACRGGPTEARACLPTLYDSLSLTHTHMFLTLTHRHQGEGGLSNGSRANNGSSNQDGFWSNWFSKGNHPSNPHPNNGHKKKQNSSGRGGEIATLLKPRKAPIKIEPKVFFANERTFLAWMHLSVTLAGASIAILAFAEDDNPFSQLYGIVLLPVAIAFIVYSMFQYSRRCQMIRTRHPGPYEDTTGPALLGVMLMVSIVAQFALKLYSMSSA
jgi:uncharacterized membrane protein YidH (DUF202 family)